MLGVPIAVEVDCLAARKISVSDVAESTAPVCILSPSVGEEIRTRDPAVTGQLGIRGAWAADSVGATNAAEHKIRMSRIRSSLGVCPADYRRTDQD
jgi:hypothetical protein